MVEPQKPFACSDPECGMTFTNEDHLHVHSKKHDMVLQLGFEQKSAFVADQTPTPTRFIRNCEEVGLFQDLNVNPFDEGFKRAIENKHGIVCLESATGGSAGDDVLNTPQMTFPLLEGDASLYSSSNNQRNISRSSSDESGAIKEYETTTISKLTNEVTTISRIVGKQDLPDSAAIHNDIAIVQHKEFRVKDTTQHETQSLSYKNNVIKIHRDIEIKKDKTIVNNELSNRTEISYTDSVIKDTNIITKDVVLNDLKIQDKAPPIMSQKSLDFVVDSLNEATPQDYVHDKSDTDSRRTMKCEKTKSVQTDMDLKEVEDFEAIIKLPGGKRVKMKAIKEEVDPLDTKDILRRSIKKENVQQVRSQNNVHTQQPGQKMIPLMGTLIPVQLKPVKFAIPKLPITKVPTAKMPIAKIPVQNDGVKKVVLRDKESQLAASKRYRERIKLKQDRIIEENAKLKNANQTLIAEKAVLKMIIMEHLKKCPMSEELRTLYQKNS